MSWQRVRLDWVARDMRTTVDATALGPVVFNYSIPALEETGDGQFEDSAEIGSGKLLLSGGEVLIAKLNPRKARVVITSMHEVPTICSTEFVAFEPTAIDRKFLYYLLNSEAVRSRLDGWVQSVTRSHQRVRPEDISKMWIDYPPLSVQRAIADYLDAETARIDALIEKKRRMIELLDERERIDAEQLILRGTQNGDLDVVGHALYGAIPAEWGATQMRHLRCEVQTGPFGSQLHAEDYVDDGWPVINPMNIVSGALRDDDAKRVGDEKRRELSRHILFPGDIVFGRRGEMGRAGLVSPEQAGWLCGTGCLRIRLSDSRLQPNYLKMLLETGPARDYFSLSSVGSTMENLNSEILLSLPIVLPDVGEQSRIVERVTAERCRSSEVRSALDRQILILGEHRQALITAAVTGELAIPGVAA